MARCMGPTTPTPWQLFGPPPPAQEPGSRRSPAGPPLLAQTPDGASPSPAISRPGPTDPPRRGTDPPPPQRPYPSRRLTAGLPGRSCRPGPLSGARRRAAPAPGAPGGCSEGLRGRGGPAGEQRQQQAGQQPPHGGGRPLRGRVGRRGDFPGVAPEPGRASAAASIRHRSPPTAARAGGGGAPSSGTSPPLSSPRHGPGRARWRRPGSACGRWGCSSGLPRCRRCPPCWPPPSCWGCCWVPPPPPCSAAARSGRAGGERYAGPGAGRWLAFSAVGRLGVTGVEESGVGYEGRRAQGVPAARPGVA